MPPRKKSGFGEAPQAPLEGAPLTSGPISSWADEIARDAEAGAAKEKPKRRVKGRGDPTLSDRSIPLEPSTASSTKTGR